MNILLLTFQLSLTLFVLLSFFLIIFVPFVFASVNGWSNNKNLVVFSTTIWSILIILIGILNFFVI
jgi:photosystem II PsbZ protein